MLAAFEVPLRQTVAVGVVVGLTYAAFATGLVLVHRAQRVVNLAHVQIGSVGAAALAYLVNQLGFPWWVAFVVGIAASAGIAALIEMTVMRRLADSPRLTVLVATVGLAQLLVLVTYLVTDHTPDRRDGFPSPIDAVRTVGGGDLRLSPGQQLVLLLVPPALLAVAALLRFTDLGVVVRAASENRDAANLAGVSVGLVTTGVWALAGGLSGVTAGALAPDRGLVLSDVFSAELLVRALAAAVVARMASIGIACLAGIAIGVLEQIVFFNWPGSPGAVDLALLFVILAAFLLQPAGREGRGRDDRSGWTAALGARPLAPELRTNPRVRRAAAGATVLAVTVAAVVPLALSNRQTQTLIVIGCFVLLALSITVLTGAAGQVSLGQVAFLGVGAAVAYQVSRAHELPFLVGVVVAALVGAALTVAIGVPALRRPGLFLAVTTLSFALVTPRWLLPQTWMLGSGVSMGRPEVLGIDLSGQHAYYLFVLAVLVASITATRALLAGPVGRGMIAVRDNERQAAALGLGPTRTKVLAFGLAGAMASATGALYGAAIENFGPENFAVADSLRMLSVAVIGGLGSVAGTVTAAFAVFGVDRLVEIPQLRLLTTSLGLLAVVLFLPGGLVQPLMAVRDVLARRIAGSGPAAAPSADAAEAAASPPVDLAGVVADLPRAAEAATAGAPCLRVEGVTVRFGGIVAVDDVSLEVAQGEVVGLLGPNGAGKTTLLEAISGHVRPEAGTVELGGERLDRLPPQARVGRGLVRSFQDARLFPSLTVRQVLLLAQQHRLPTSTVAAVLGTPGARRCERERAAHVDAVLAAVGLDRYAEATVGELSTGTRRICELAAAVSLGPRLLLLDEPSSGLAQREVEELPRVLADVVARTGVALVVVEHDVPFLSAVADRLVALQAGRVIAEGPPAEVCADEEVVRAYLGGDATANRPIGHGGRMKAPLDRLPDIDRMVGWIEDVCAFGIRRPGSDAGHRVEEWVAEALRSAGVEDVRLDPIATPTWEPGPARLVAWPAGRPDDTVTVEGFPLPFTGSSPGVEADVVLLDRAAPAVEGCIAVDPVELTRLPTEWMRHMATPVHDPGPALDGYEHLLPFGAKLGKEVDDAITAGAVGYVGALVGMPWTTRSYYVPYDAEARELPAVWIDRADGARLLDLLAAGPVRGRLEVVAATAPGTSHNVMGTLPGASDEWVIIGSHHDAPWASAVEDGTGIVLVLAQAEAWAAMPPEERPHNLLFLLNGGHMTGGAGIMAVLERQRDLLDRTVLAVHLEHAAAAVEVVDDRLIATDAPEVAWWFTSRDPALEADVAAALAAHGVERAWVLPPEVFGPFPPTDGGPLHLAGVPLVDVLSAPVYLFDEADTLDLVHRPSLGAISRAAAQIVAGTAGRSAAGARGAVVP